jgi:hypothetical protein
MAHQNLGYDFHAAVASSPRAPPRGGGGVDNRSLLSDPSVKTSLQRSFSLLDAGSIDLNTFRGQLFTMGLRETPEAAKLLSGVGAASFQALVRALISGTTDAAADPVTPATLRSPASALAASSAVAGGSHLVFGRPSTAGRKEDLSTAAQSNILGHGPRTLGREDRGDRAYASAAAAAEHTSSSLSSSQQPFFNQCHTKQRQLNRQDQVESGVGALLSYDAGAGAGAGAGSAATHPASSVVGVAAREAVHSRVLSLLPQLDSGALSLPAFRDHLSKLGLPSLHPSLDRHLRAVPSHGRLNMDACMRVVDACLADPGWTPPPQYALGAAASTSTSTAVSASVLLAPSYSSWGPASPSGSSSSFPASANASASASSASASGLPHVQRESLLVADPADLARPVRPPTASPLSSARGGVFASPHIPGMLRSHGDIVTSPPPEPAPAPGSRGSPRHVPTASYMAWYGESAPVAVAPILSYEQKTALENAVSGPGLGVGAGLGLGMGEGRVRAEAHVTSRASQLPQHPSRTATSPSPFATGW